MTFLHMLPTAFECFGDTSERVFTVQVFDDFTSTVEIKTIASPDSWRRISALVLKALEDIHGKDVPFDSLGETK